VPIDPATDPTILSLLPVGLALALSITSRNVILGLFSGVFVGVLLVEGPSPIRAVTVMVRDYLVPQVTDSYNAGVLVLLAFIGGFVSLMERSGGGAAFAARVARFITTSARLQVSAWVGGIIIFFSDLGTPLIIGPTFRPLADRLTVSRAKLAYIIDSTASPVAILVPFIGWGVYIMGLLNQQIELLGLDVSDYSLLLSALPFQFYAWLALFAVPVLAVSGAEFGPMRQAEVRAQLKTEGSEQIADTPAGKVSLSRPNARPSFVWLPLLTLGVTLFWILSPLGFPFGRVSGSDFRAGLAAAYLVAALTLVGLMALHRAQSPLESFQIYLDGMSRMMQIAIMLLLAWAMGDMMVTLGADNYVATLVRENVVAWTLPLLIFAVACVISFATGSSWGTFAIILPLTLPAAAAIDISIAVCIGAVLSGGLFGDHCSPISETTILASAGAGCDVFEHFRTQLPYALANGALCLIGFVVSSVSQSVAIVAMLLAMQTLVLLVIGKFQLKRFP
jgi:Na+/H+ antiporter NhaC